MLPAKLLIGKRVKQEEETVPQEPVSSDSARASWKTLSGQKSRHMSYRSRMTLMFALVAIMTVTILSSVLLVTWEEQFTQYTRSNMERYASVMSETLATSYETNNGWDFDQVEYTVQAASISSEVGVQVLNEDGDVFYDDTWATSASHATVVAQTDAPEQVQEGSAEGEPKEGPDPAENVSNAVRISLAPTNSEALVSKDIMLSDGTVVGTVRLWAFGSEALLTKSDAAFRTNSYSAVASAGIIAVFIACLMGIGVSRKLAKPVKKITNTAAQIRSGDLTARTGIVGDDEIGQLGETFDDMATSLERDLKLEHRLTGDVAHELRTPLMAMLATVEAMQDGVLPADTEHLETVAGEVRRLSRLVAAMLQLSRIENGTTPFKPEKTEMVGLVRSIVDSQEQLFEDRSLRLRYDVKVNNLRWDIILLQVLQKLLSIV